MKYLKKYRKNRILKVKNSRFELENYLKEWKDRKLKNIKIKIRKEIEDLFFKPVITPIEDKNIFE